MNICVNTIAPALKWLSLCNKQDDYLGVDFKVLIDAPMLEWIYLGDDYLAAYSVTSLPCLAEATLDVGMDFESNFTADKNLFAHVIEIIRILSNVKHLSVMSGASAALDWADKDLPVLHGVTSLKLDDLPLTGVTLLTKFLQSAPNLKVVVVTIQPEVENFEGWSWISPGTLPTSLSHLERFEIQGAEIIDREESFYIVKKYIIENAKALRTVRGFSPAT